jgi:hypothetical protein
MIPKHCNPLHWQIRGGQHIVNFYPSTKRGQRFYVDGAAHGASGELSKAIQAAGGSFSLPPNVRPTSNRDGQRRRRRKKRLLKLNPHCHYCGDPITMETATIDHAIPLCKGGGDFDSNYRLSCKKCNTRKADYLPAEFNVQPPALTPPGQEPESVIRVTADDVRNSTGPSPVAAIVVRLTAEASSLKEQLAAAQGEVGRLRDHLTEVGRIVGRLAPRDAGLKKHHKLYALDNYIVDALAPQAGGNA